MLCEIWYETVLEVDHYFKGTIFFNKSTTQFEEDLKKKKINKKTKMSILCNVYSLYKTIYEF